MASAADVKCLFEGFDSEQLYENVNELTYINDESHGPGPAGRLEGPAGKRRLILHAKFTIATDVEMK